MLDATILMIRMDAYCVFLDKGISEVHRLYPECAQFIEQNKHKPFDEVKRELLYQIELARVLDKQ